MRRSSSTHAVVCAAGAFMFSSFVLGNLVSGGSGLTVVEGMVDSSLIASLFSINSSCCSLVSCLPTRVPLRQTSSDLLPTSSASFLLVAQVENVELQCHVAKCELHDPISAIDDGI